MTIESHVIKIPKGTLTVNMDTGCNAHLTDTWMGNAVLVNHESGLGMLRVYQFKIGRQSYLVNPALVEFIQDDLIGKIFEADGEIEYAIGIAKCKGHGEHSPVIIRLQGAQYHLKHAVNELRGISEAMRRGQSTEGL